MKNFKLLFTVLLLSVFTAQSQVKPYVINQQLQLKTVPLGAASDSVMVVDATGLVRHVPKSSIGGGSQDLQQTIENGPYAALDGGTVSILTGIDYERGFGYHLNNDDNSNFTELIASQNSTSISSKSGTNNSALQIAFGKTKIQEDTAGGTTILDFETPIANTTIKFPAKVSGNYFLATKDDITLQKALETGNTVVDMPINFNSSVDATSSTVDAGSFTSRFTGSGETSFRLQGVYTSNPSFNGSNKLVTTRTDSGDAIFNLGNRVGGSYTIATLDDITGGSQDLQQTLENGNTADRNLILQNEDNSHTFDVTGLGGYEGTSADYSWQMNGEGVSFTKLGNQAKLLFERNQTGQITYQFPDKVEGIYTVATLDDIVGGSQDLQQTMDNGMTFSSSLSGAGNIEFGFSGTEYNLVSAGSGGGADYSSHNMDTNYNAITEFSGGNSWAIGVTSDEVFTDIGIKFTRGSFTSKLQFEDPISISENTTFLIPIKPEGTYKLATIDDSKTILHTEIATSTGVVSSVGANWTGTGTALNTNYIGGQVFIEGVGVATIATLDEGAQTFTTLQPLLSDVTDSAFELRTIAYKLYDNGDQKWFDAHEGSPRITLNADGNFFANSFSALANGASNVGLLTNGNSEFWGDKVTSPLLINKIVYTVATLPTPDSGERAYASVSDALAPTYLGVLVGGGTINCPVYWNGTAWISH